MFVVLWYYPLSSFYVLSKVHLDDDLRPFFSAKLLNEEHTKQQLLSRSETSRNFDFFITKEISNKSLILGYVLALCRSLILVSKWCLRLPFFRCYFSTAVPSRLFK